MAKLLLASSSPFRKALLQRLNMPFTTSSPDIDESPLFEESIPEMVLRLSEAKALTGHQNLPQTQTDTFVIGSDQTAELNGTALTKPGSIKEAIKQLTQASGKTITFHTGFSLVSPSGEVITTTSIPTTVAFRELTNSEIEHYIQQEKPLNCAGSFKVEGLGITLFESVTSDDPTALMGLPLITTAHYLRQVGLI